MKTNKFAFSVLKQSAHARRAVVHEREGESFSHTHF